MRYAIAVTAALAIAAAAVLLGAHIVGAQANTLYVPADYPTIQQAIDAALATYSTHTNIYVAPGVYTESLVIPASADIYLVAETPGQPWNTAIQFDAASSMYATITIDANQTNPAYPPSVVGEPTDRLVIEGFEIGGGPNGILLIDVPIDSAGTEFRPTVSACYIRNNTDNGVLVADAGAPQLINCSIVENGGDGVRVNDDANIGTATFADLLFCTVAMNGDHGVYVEAPAPGDPPNNARVRDNQDLNAFIASQTALGRAGQVDDIGGVVAFLASEEARWITGQRIEVSGGMFL